MFRTFLTCILLMTAITGLTAGALARADTKSHATAATGVRAEAAAGPAKSAPVRPAPKSGGAQEGAAKADKGAQAGNADAQPTGAVKLSGESVLGNQNAPKSLVLVPWKSAQIGKMPGLSMLLDDSIRPVDKDVFMRELAYYRIRAGSK